MVAVQLRAKRPDVCKTIQRRVSVLSRGKVTCRDYPNIDTYFKTTTSLGLRCALPSISRSLVVAQVTKEATMPRGRDVRDFTTRRTSVTVCLDAKVLRRLSQHLMGNKCRPSAPTTLICGTA